VSGLRQLLMLVDRSTVRFFRHGFRPRARGMPARERSRFKRRKLFTPQGRA
jgi:hypothetical protein